MLDLQGYCKNQVPVALSFTTVQLLPPSGDVSPRTNSNSSVDVRLAIRFKEDCLDCIYNLTKRSSSMFHEIIRNIDYPFLLVRFCPSATHQLSFHAQSLRLSSHGLELLLMSWISSRSVLVLTSYHTIQLNPGFSMNSLHHMLTEMMLGKVLLYAYTKQLTFSHPPQQPMLIGCFS